MGVIVTKSLGGGTVQTDATAAGGRKGTYDIPSGVSDFTVTFTPELSASYQIIGNLVNTIDPSASLYVTNIFDKNADSFKVELSDFTDSVNYQFDWLIPAAPSGVGVFTLDEKLALEMEMEYKAANASYYKEFIYKETFPNRGALLSAAIWSDTDKTERLFTKIFEYKPNNPNRNALIYTEVFRDSDGAKLLNFFEYKETFPNRGSLLNKTVSAGY